MKRCLRKLLCIATFVGTPAFAQDVAVNRENKTVSVVATETIRVSSDMATVSIGYRNSSESKEGAYEENVRTAKRILGALLQAGVPEENIESSKLSFDYDLEESAPAGKAKRLLFVARQGWTIRVAATDAQKVVESAVKSGANEVDDVEWAVADPSALEEKAMSAALAKARRAATELAASTGQKLGALLHLSNSDSSGERFIRMYWMRREVQLPSAELRLFPKKVEQKATVHAIFALE